MDVLLFQGIQVAIGLPFAFFISFYRKKTGFKPIIAEKWTYLLKASALIALFIYVYSMAFLTGTGLINWLGSGFGFMGALCVVKAKLDLSKSHTWAGYYMESPKLVDKGIYSYIRHPLYVGIYLFVFGMLFSLHSNASWFLAVVSMVALIYVLAFLAVVAKRETNMLEEHLGEKFADYKKKVHFCLPIRKYERK